MFNIHHLSKALLLLTASLSSANAQHPPSTPENEPATSLLHSSMTFMDTHYDPSAGYLFSLTSALLHETRSSAWYATGLLARNNPNTTDVPSALHILNNIISPQFKNASEQWYGDYQVYPEQPYPGSPAYPAKIYKTWDPNWRGFIGTAFIVILEEFPHFLPIHLKEKILASLHLAAKGDSYRVGGIDGDNFYPCYSNAALMHAVLSSYVGLKTGDTNLTRESEVFSREILSLYNLNSTLSEFNSPTYLGVSLLALTMGAKYLPSQNSTLGREAGRMITEVWDLVGRMYHAGMKNLAGPWDRSYGYDQQRYLSIMGLWIWSFVGLEKAPVYEKSTAVAHVDDFEIGPLIALLAPYHRQYLSSAALSALTHFPGPHTVHATTFSPPYDLQQRNITTYLSDKLTIGAESFNENVIGGPSVNPSQFNPVVIQWSKAHGRTGFITLYPEVSALQAEVIGGEGDKGRLNLTYPHGNETSTFTFHVDSNGLYGVKNVESWDDIDGIRVKAVAGTVELVPRVSFCGIVGGDCETINEFDFWNFTYSMPAGSSEVPNIVLDFEVV